MPLKILVVDDVDTELQLICNFLREEGYVVSHASNGQDALQKAINEQPDVIVSDLIMPIMDGLELFRKLKKIPETAKIPFIACTTKDREPDRKWAEMQGVKGYVTKPFTKEHLIKTLQIVAST
jgi:twitching motility two-component system response regulator PilH